MGKALVNIASIRPKVGCIARVGLVGACSLLCFDNLRGIMYLYERNAQVAEWQTH